LALFGRRPQQRGDSPSFRRPKTCTEHDIKQTLLIADASDAVLRLAYLDRSKTSVETVGWP
jgi:hypothetical protein